MSYTFAGYQPPFRCSIPCEDGNLSTSASISLEDRDWYQQLDTDSINAQCEFYSYSPGHSDTGGCRADMFNESHVVQCNSYVYDRSIFTETLVTNFDLVCGEKWKKGFIGRFKTYILLIHPYSILQI